MRPQLLTKSALGLILLAGAALRLYHLGADSLWYDETVSTFLAGSRLAELLRHTAGDIHPPGYYSLLRGWLVLTGYPTGHADPRGIGLEFSAGFFSLFFGVLLIALAYALARRVTNHRVGLIAALLVAFSPYNVWYSQEVRMYTLGAALGVIVVYALLRIGQRSRVRSQGTGDRGQESGERRRGTGDREKGTGDGSQATDRGWQSAGWWAVYAVAAAAGMYTLYYFVFLLIPVNLWVLWQIADSRWRMVAKPGKWQMAESKGQPPAAGQPHPSSTPAAQTVQLPASNFRLPPWLLANLAAVLLYAPWIPVAFRQATNPPVPPWRTAPELWKALHESWTALSLGQSAPSWLWPALLLTLGLYGLGLVALWQMANGRWQIADNHQLSAISYKLSAIGYLPVATLGPLALILLVSLVTPLYHVRYLFTYSPPFYVVMAVGLAWLLRRSRVAFGVALVVWLAAAGVTLCAYWHDPAYRADDHRAAVRSLREHWRPGDVVLVNAGWPYTALTTYWDGSIATRSRLTGDLTAASDAPDALVMVTTGHVDGDPGLGWGDPRSDFFAMPADEAKQNLTALFGKFDRVWQYRIYDTVNDPAGKVRGWLADDGHLIDDQVFTGEANMRVQGFVPRQAATPDPSWQSAAFGTNLSVRAKPPPDRITSGETLYPTLEWQFTGTPVDFAASIRLIGPDGAIWAQPPDEQPSGSMLPASQWAENQAYRQTLKLPVPAGTPPGPYSADLVVYDPVTGQPWPSQAGDLATTPNGLRLGEITVVRPDPSPNMQPALATFGPLALIEATSPATTVAPGGQVPVELLWQAAEAPGEPFVVVTQLLDTAGHVVAGLEAQPLDGRYPTQNWTSGELVRDRQTLTLPADLKPGAYRLIVGLYRAADRARLETKVGLLGKSDHWAVTTVDVK